MRNPGRRPTESSSQNRRPPPPTPTNTVENWLYSTPVNRRDSDVSLCSSRPSTVRSSAAVININDRSYHKTALRTINSYLASQSFPISLKHPLPSAKDITETLKFLVQQFGFNGQKLDDDLNLVLKFMKCPLKLNKSALRAPGTPHSWPNLLPVIHWLVQIVKYKDFQANSPTSLEKDHQLQHMIESYGYFIRGEMDEMYALDAKCEGEMNTFKDGLEAEVNGLEENVKELEEKLARLKAEPSRKDALEKDKSDLEKDLMKFNVLIERLVSSLEEEKKKLEIKEKALEEKVDHMKSICSENEDLKKTIEEQGINSRDAERMKRELHAVERDIEELENARNGWEEKSWELDPQIGHKFKELEQFAMNCNQAIRRLKLGNEFQYQLDAKGSSATEVLGSDYKTTLKPALTSFAEDIKISSMENLQELISLRQKFSEISGKLEAKHNSITSLQSHIDEANSKMKLMVTEAQQNTSRCATEARKMAEEIEIEAQRMCIVEKEAAEFSQMSKEKLEEIIEQTEKEVKLCMQELFGLINSVSAYKEHVGLQVAQMGKDLRKTASDIADMYKGDGSSQGKVVSPDFSGSNFKGC